MTVKTRERNLYQVYNLTQNADPKEIVDYAKNTSNVNRKFTIEKNEKGENLLKISWTYSVKLDKEFGYNGVFDLKENIQTIPLNKTSYWDDTAEHLTAWIKENPSVENDLNQNNLDQIVLQAEKTMLVKIKTQIDKAFDKQQSILNNMLVKNVDHILGAQKSFQKGIETKWEQNLDQKTFANLPCQERSNIVTEWFEKTCSKYNFEPLDQGAGIAYIEDSNSTSKFEIGWEELYPGPEGAAVALIKDVLTNKYRVGFIS